MEDSGETGGEDSGDTSGVVLGNAEGIGDTGGGDTGTGSSEEKVSGNRKDRETEGEEDTVEDDKA